MRHACFFVAPGVIALAIACGSTGSDTGQGVDAGADARPTTDSALAGDGAVTTECAAGTKLCLAHDRTKRCETEKGSTRWVEATCAAGSGCVRGDCVPSACSDECVEGATAAGKTCTPYDIKTGQWVTSDPRGRLHDRARAYQRWLQTYALLYGSVVSPHFSDAPAATKLDGANGIGDAAIWTGTYLAAEALRYGVTGASEARASIRRLVAQLHLHLSVSGDPGMLARYVLPTGTRPAFNVGEVDCGSSDRMHCGVTYDGKKYDYLGHVSRDQYQGVMLGYGLAFDALGPADEDLREIIRKDVVTFVKELMRERSIAVDLTYGGIRLTRKTLTLRFVVTSGAELTPGGAIAVNVDELQSGGDVLSGFQEFTPDLGDMVKQIVPFAPAIERSSSAIMLTSFFELALHMTDGAAAYKVDRDAITAYFSSRTGTGGNVKDWLAIANRWTSSPGCGDKYYANNITMEPMYNLARLTKDPARRAIVVDSLLKTRLWPAYEKTKNVFFSYIYAGNMSGGDAAATASARLQLAQFPPPPHLNRSIDLRTDARYLPADAACADHTTKDKAVDVADRASSDFIWQREPWNLYAPADPNQGEPGVDYLVAYWMGRSHAFVSEDTDGRCLAWK